MSSPQAPGTSGSKETPMYHKIDIGPTAVPAPIQPYASSQPQSKMALTQEILMHQSRRQTRSL